MASKRNKTLRLQGNTADVKDIQEVGLWDTVQAAPVGTREDGSKYNVRLPKGYSYVGYSGQLQNPEQVKHRGSWGGADNAHMGDENWNAVQKAKADWKTAYDAGDQAGMDAAHAAAEAIRAGYGYSGGADGSEYLPLMFKSEGYVEEDSGDGGDGRGGYGYPGFSSRYDPQIQALYQAILSREPFSYDAASDPLYGQYKQSYTRGGQRAMQDTLGQMALRTGGLASSYAESAAQQTYDNYMAALADKIPELQQLAYQRYQDELSGKRADLSMLLGLDDVDYNRWSGDRSFDYNAYRDGVADEQWAKSFDYQQQRDAASDSQWQQQWDYSLAQEDYTRRLQLAQQYAELTGDYSGFLEAGWTPEQVAAASRAYQQQGAAAAAKGSGGSSGGKQAKATPSGTDWSQVEAYVSDYGGDAEDYIGANYKALGYSSKSAAFSAWKVYQQKQRVDGERAQQKEQGTAYNSSYFYAALSSINTALRHGALENLSGALDRLWPKLSAEQKQKLQELLALYSVQYEYEGD